jgi:cell division protein FtsB
MKSKRTSADGRFRRVSPSERRGIPHGKWIVTWVLTAVLLLAALFGSGGLMVVRKEAAAVDALDAELLAVEAELSESRARTEALVEPGGLELERVAREEYRMHAPGEEVILLVPAEGSAEEEADRTP